MEVNELRIGNYICANEKTGDIGMVFSIEKYEVSILKQIIGISYQEYRMHPGHFTPVPLTEDWLIRFGFKKSNIGDWYVLDIINEWTNIQVTPLHGFGELSISKHSCVLKLQHVHQLQNLYFALTQTELTLPKPPQP